MVFSPPGNQNGQNMNSPSGDLRQARPHKPILTLCSLVVFDAEAQPDRSESEHGKEVMEETQGV